jgi:hypothetical protein
MDFHIYPFNCASLEDGGETLAFYRMLLAGRSRDSGPLRTKDLFFIGAYESKPATGITISSRSNNSYN